jgi:hypothetical protein
MRVPTAIDSLIPIFQDKVTPAVMRAKLVAAKTCSCEGREQQASIQGARGFVFLGASNKNAPLA